MLALTSALSLAAPHAAPATHALQATVGPEVRVVVMTLGDRRRALVDAMRAELGTSMVELNATDGFDKSATARQLLRGTNMEYHQMCGADNAETGTRSYESWGTLANFLTRFEALDAQVKANIPFQATLEDDLQLHPGFGNFLSTTASRYFSNPSNASDLVILGHYGEGYLTSLEAARHIVQTLNAEGIVGCPDQQLNYMMDDQIQRKVFLGDHTPWTVAERPGQAVLQTALMTGQEKRTLQNLRSDNPAERSAALEAIQDFGYQKLSAARTERTSRAAYYKTWMASDEYKAMKAKADQAKSAKAARQASSSSNKGEVSAAGAAHKRSDGARSLLGDRYRRA